MLQQKTNEEERQTYIQALFLALEDNNLESVKKSMDLGRLTSNDIEKYKGKNTLIYVIDQGFNDIALYLIGIGVNVNYINEEQNSPLDCAVKKQQFEVAKSILLQGGKPSNIGKKFFLCYELKINIAYDMQQKNAINFFHVGLLYDKGYGVLPNDVLASYWYLCAAILEHPIAIYNLSILFFDEQRDVSNYEALSEWIKIAVTQRKIPEALVFQGYLYEQGIAFERDPIKAFQLYEQAIEIDRNCAEALFRISLCYKSGTGTQHDAKLAKTYFDMAIDRKHGAALRILSKDIESSKSIHSGSEYFVADEKAKHNLNLAAENGDAQAQCELGVSAWNKYDDRYSNLSDRVEALGWLRKSAKQGYNESFKYLVAILLGKPVQGTSETIKNFEITEGINWLLKGLSNGIDYISCGHMTYSFNSNHPERDLKKLLEQYTSFNETILKKAVRLCELGQAKIKREKKHEHYPCYTLPLIHPENILLQASENNNMAMYRDYIDFPGINATGINAKALAKSIEKGHFEFSQEVLRIDSNMIASEIEKEMPLDLMIKKVLSSHQYELYELLLNLKELDVPKLNSKAIVILLEIGGFDYVLKLLTKENDLDVNRTGEKGLTPIELAIASSRRDIVELIISKRSFDINYRYPLLAAVFEDEEKITEMLLEHPKIQVNVVKEPGSETALWIASRHGNVRIVKALLNRKEIDVDYRCNKLSEQELSLHAEEGKTKLNAEEIASDHGHGEVVQIIKEFKEMKAIREKAAKRREQAKEFVESEVTVSKNKDTLQEETLVYRLLKLEEENSNLKQYLLRLERQMQEQQEASQRENKSIRKEMTDMFTLFKSSLTEGISSSEKTLTRLHKPSGMDN